MRYNVSAVCVRPGLSTRKVCVKPIAGNKEKRGLQYAVEPRLAYYSFVGGRFSFCPLSVFQSIRLLFIWLGFGFIFGFYQFVKNDS
jgi:hypothetical protein